jgi:hypothetical protein
VKPVPYRQQPTADGERHRSPCAPVGFPQHYLERVPVPATQRVPAANSLLAALPRQDRQRFLANCEQVELVFAEVLYEQGARIRHVYFPTDSFISLVMLLDDHARLEVGLVGNEGMLGVCRALGIPVSPLHALVQGAGPALRMDDRRFGDELERSPALRRVLNRYLYVLMSQFSQMAACTRFHVVEAR